MARQSPGILIGRITGAHGIRGAVKLQSYAANATDIASYGLLATASGQHLEIARLKPAKDGFIADLKGISDRNKAEALSGSELFADREKFPPATAGEVYLADLVGKQVMVAGRSLGVVAGIQNFGAGDLLELDDGLLIPAAFVVEVGDEVSVNLPDGYLDNDIGPPGQNGRP